VPPTYPRRYYEISAVNLQSAELRALVVGVVSTLAYTDRPPASPPFTPLPEPGEVPEAELLLTFFADEPDPTAVDAKLRQAMFLFQQPEGSASGQGPTTWTSGLALLTARYAAQSHGCGECTAEAILDDLLSNPDSDTTQSLSTALLDAALRLSDR